ncbi:CoA ester lyase [Amycolatopsis rhabdoformis]|uniref:CoA ester lyase n=1 Tax=Amycolatopsis rhabdoformis TaxID=1448059 RepID=A0ABZ1IGI4_9PSEU|nr:CoA ester lyase [Amycolatopsis rhabdoformis]WSE32545.1 CoA ester lyase [Amycolatopsis rhabdoformis]
MDAEVLAAARTLLFVPGDRPERFAKAAASGADAIVIDLEDAVGPGNKRQALRNARDWLAAGHEAVIRLNATGTPWHPDELAALADRPVAVLVPKSADPAALAGVLAALTPGSVAIPLVETAAGVLGAPAVAAVPGVVRLAFGHVDLSTELGVPPEGSPTLDQARSTLVLACAAAGIAPPLDGVTTALDDPAVLAADVARAQLLGLTGKLCVHPRQVPLVHEAFAPTEAELSWARSVTAAATDGASSVGGQLVDRPVLLRAERLLGQADRRGGPRRP